MGSRQVVPPTNHVLPAFRHTVAVIMAAAVTHMRQPTVRGAKSTDVVVVVFAAENKWVCWAGVEIGHLRCTVYKRRSAYRDLWR